MEIFWQLLACMTTGRMFSRDRFPLLDQVICWSQAHIKIALAIKAMLIFFPLAIFHRSVPYFFPFKHACAKSLAIVLNPLQGLLHPPYTLPARLTLPDWCLPFGVFTPAGSPRSLLVSCNRRLHS